MAGLFGGTLLALGHLGKEGAALDGVDEHEAGLDHGVSGPAADHLGLTPTRELVVFGVDVEISTLADAVAGGVLGDGRDVVDARTGAVVGLEA